MNLAFIPVRGGSKSIPLKNIKILNGKPLVYWTAKASNEAKCIDKVVISTDSQEIKNIVLNFGFEKLEVFNRNAQNASDIASTESAMLEYIESANLNSDDNFFLIQATSPTIKSGHIDRIYDKYVKSGADSIFSSVRRKQFHWLEAGDDYQDLYPINYDYNNRPRRQEARGILAENGACYINKVENIIRDKCRLSGKIVSCELPMYTAYEIDEAIDWIIVENIMKSLGSYID